MNIDGLSEATLEKFIARGFIHDFGDIFEIEKYRDEIVAMDGFGEKSFNNLTESLEKAKPPLWQKSFTVLESPISALPMQK